MRSFSQEQKDAAAGSQDRAGYAVAASGPLVAGVAFVPVAGPFLALAGAAVGAAIAIRAIQQGRVVRDPPDPNFREPVRVAEPRLDLSRLREGQFPLRAAAFARANEKAGSVCGAMVRSLERAMGAEMAGEADYAANRLGEASELADELAQLLELCVELNPPLREALLDLEGVEPVVWAESVKLGDVVPESVLAELYRAGIPRPYVFSRRSRARVIEAGGSLEDPVGTLVGQLHELEEGDRLYAEAIRCQREAGSLFVDGEGMSAGGPPVPAG